MKGIILLLAMLITMGLGLISDVLYDPSNAELLMINLLLFIASTIVLDKLLGGIE